MLPYAALAARTENPSPSPGAQVSALCSVTVIFSEAVVGVQADDLIIAGVGATAVTGSGTTFTFTFTQPAPGLVSRDWDRDNEITNAAGVPFVSPGPWSYTLVDTVAPTLSAVSPPGGSSSNALAQAVVTFSERVTRGGCGRFVDQWRARGFRKRQRRGALYLRFCTARRWPDGLLVGRGPRPRRCGGQGFCGGARGR